MNKYWMPLYCNKYCILSTLQKGLNISLFLDLQQTTDSYKITMILVALLYWEWQTRQLQYHNSLYTTNALYLWVRGCQIDPDYQPSNLKMLDFIVSTELFPLIIFRNIMQKTALTLSICQVLELLLRLLYVIKSTESKMI